MRDRYVIKNKRIWDRVNACYVTESFYDWRQLEAECKKRNQHQTRNEQLHDTPPLH